MNLSFDMFFLIFLLYFVTIFMANLHLEYLVRPFFGPLVKILGSADGPGGGGSPPRAIFAKPPSNGTPVTRTLGFGGQDLPS